MNSLLNLQEWLSDHNCQIKSYELDGKIHRFSWQSKSGKDGWFIGSIIGHDDNQAPIIIATVGSWKSNERIVHKSFQCDKKKYRIIAEKTIKLQAKKYDKEKELQRRSAQLLAKTLIERSKSSGSHPYLKLKKLSNLFGSKIDSGESSKYGSTLVIPMQDIDGNIVGAQKISENGKKFFITGQQVKGAFHIIEGKRLSEYVFIGEGFATVATIAMATKSPCVVAFNANNLLPVGLNIARKFPYSKIVFVGDDDIWTENVDGSKTNPGREKAEMASKLVGAATVFPRFANQSEENTDFNDLHVHEGLEKVIDQLSSIGPFSEPERLNVTTGDRQQRDIIEDTWKAILHRNRPEPFLFQRGGNLIRLKKNHNKIFIQPLGLNEIFGTLVREINWVKMVKDKITNEVQFRAITPNKNLLGGDLLAFTEPSLPQLDTVVSVATLGSNGKFVLKPGYHPSEKIFADPKGLFKITIPNSPSYKDAIAAREYISKELFYDFPFRSKSDWANAFALLIQPFIRPFIKGPTPLFSIEANTPGSGKSLLASLVSILTMGKNPTIRSFPSDDDEVRKNITSTLLSGPQIVVIDNVRENRIGIIDSSSLAALLTTQFWEDRILGQNKIITLPNSATWIITANDPKFSVELQRRRILISLDSGASQPWKLQGFRHPCLIEWVLKNRSLLVTKILTIVQAWLITGTPKSKKSLGSYEDWSATIGGILEFAEIEDFLIGTSSEKPNDPLEEWAKLIQIWQKKFPLASLQPKEINRLCEENGLLQKERGAGSLRSKETIVGNSLQLIQGKNITGYKIIMTKDLGHHGKKYSLVKEII